MTPVIDPLLAYQKATGDEVVDDFTTEAELARAEGRTYETAEELLKRVSPTTAEEPKGRTKKKSRAS